MLVATPIAQLASELSGFGLTVVSEPQISPSDLEAARAQTSSRLHSLLGAISQAGADAVEQHYTFAEISHRQRMRWDLRMPPDDAPWQHICDTAVQAAMPIVESIHPAEKASVRTLMSGCLISRPGAEMQRWHADADTAHFKLAAADCQCRIYNIFMPLCDVLRDADGTEFWPGTHERVTPPPTCVPVGATVAPPCPAGGLIIADYRTLHRGRASIGRERQVAYVVLGVGDAAEDRSNFSPVTIADAHPRVLEQMPYWDDWEVE